MTRPYRPLAFANEFISMHARRGGTEHLKLQKLTYLAYGWWLAYHDEPILSEAPQVWAHGPVFKSLYHALKHFGRTPITVPQRETPFSEAPRVDQGDQEVLGLLEWIVNRYGERSAYDLSELTHQPDSPWRKVAAEHSFVVPRDTDIPVEAVAE